MARFEAVIFDLDNTLYDEKAYFEAAFRIIADFLSGKCGLSQNEIFAKLADDLSKKGTMYPHLFDDALADLGLDKELLGKVLELFATVNVPLEPYPEAIPLLRELRILGLKLILVTNGGPRVQRNKISLLGVEEYFDLVVFTRESGNTLDKPDPNGYRVAIERLGLRSEQTVCVGDNPYTDFVGAKSLGIHTVRLLLGEYKDTELGSDFEAEFLTCSLKDILGVIE